MNIDAKLNVQMAQRIELWPVDRLKPYERNARTHSPEQIAQICASIAEFGFTNPILVDSSDGIIAGHGRLSAAHALGLSTVPVVVLDHLSERQRRAYILADNQLALNAGWDTELLRMELTDLQDQDFDLSVIGFSDEELADLPPWRALPLSLRIWRWALTFLALPSVALAATALRCAGPLRGQAACQVWLEAPLGLHGQLSQLLAFVFGGTWTPGVAAFFGYVALGAYVVGILQWLVVRLPRQGRVAGGF